MSTEVQHTKPHLRRILIRLAAILPIVLILSALAWYGVNKLVAARLPLEELVVNGDVEGAAYVLKWQPSRFTEPDENGRILLEHIALRRRPDAVRTYAAAGGDLYLRDNKGETLMHRMAAVGNLELFTLVRAGVDVNAKSDDGSTPVDVAGPMARMYLAMYGGKSGFGADIDGEWLERLLARLDYAERHQGDYVSAMKSIPLVAKQKDASLKTLLAWLEKISPQLTEDGKPLKIAYVGLQSDYAKLTVSISRCEEIHPDLFLNYVCENAGITYNIDGREVTIRAVEIVQHNQVSKQFRLDSTKVKMRDKSIPLTANHIRYILTKCLVPLWPYYGARSAMPTYDPATSKLVIAVTPPEERSIARALRFINDWDNGVDPPPEPPPPVIEID